MNVVSIYKYLKPVKWYNDLYTKIVKEETNWWKDDAIHLASNPKFEALKELKDLFIRK